MAGKLADATSLKLFFNGLKSKFVEQAKFDETVKNYLEGNNFKANDSNVNLENYIRYLVAQVVTESEVGEELDKKYDDLKVFPSIDYFPGNENNKDAIPVEDTLYVDSSTGINYIWNGESYESNFSSIDDSSIETIFS